MARVEFKVDGTLITSDPTSPYAATWNASSATAGSHTILATAYDAAGNSASSSRSVTVPAPADTTPPTVALTSPAAGATVSGSSVALAATAADNVGVARVEFKVDGTLITSDLTSPYAATWNASSAARRQPHDPGHRLRRRGQLGLARAARSPSRLPPTPPLPTVALTSPAAGATVSGSSVALAATAADNVGVARVEFKVDGTLITSDPTSPYAATWNASSATAGSHTILATAYDAAGNSASSSRSVTVPVPADTAPPAPVAGLTAARTGSATLYWSNPSDADFAGVRVLRSTVGFASLRNRLRQPAQHLRGNRYDLPRCHGARQRCVLQRFRA